MKLSKVFSLSCALCMSVLNLGVVADSSLAVMKLQLAHEQPENHPYHVGAMEFARLVKEYSKGEMEVTIFPNGTMGKASALAESCAMGTMDFAAVFSIILEAYAPEFGVLTMPYTFKNWDHADKILDGAIGEELKKSVEHRDIKVLNFWRNGLAEIHSRIPIRTPEDMRGKKFRIQEGPSYAALSKALGAVTTPMSFGEVYSAMQLGTVDAETQTINNIFASKMFEVGKYFTKINMNFNTQPFIMSKQLWDSMTSEQQDIIARAANEATKVERAYHVEDTEKSYEGVKRGSGQIIELTDEEMKQWKDVCSAVYRDPQFERVMEIFNRIQEQE